MLIFQFSASTPWALRSACTDHLWRLWSSAPDGGRWREAPVRCWHIPRARQAARPRRRPGLPPALVVEPGVDGRAVAAGNAPVIRDGAPVLRDAGYGGKTMVGVLKTGSAPAAPATAPPPGPTLLVKIFGKDKPGITAGLFD